MTTSLRVISPPTVEPVSLEEARLHLRLDTEGSPPSHPDDPMVEMLIRAAREHAEEFTGRALTDAEYELRIDAFTPMVRFPLVPAALIEVAYLTTEMQIDPDSLEEVEVTVEVIVDPAVYVFDDDPLYPALRLGTGQSWPSPLVETGAVRIRFSGIYGAVSSPANVVPDSIRYAILMLVGHWYTNREAVSDRTLTPVPIAVDALLRPYRIKLGFA